MYNYMYATHFKRSLVTIPEETDKPISALQNTKIHCTTHWVEIIRNKICSMVNSLQADLWAKIARIYLEQFDFN